jgi:hypothetical protein
MFLLASIAQKGEHMLQSLKEEALVLISNALEKKGF